MNQTYKSIILGLFIALSVILCAFLFHQTGLSASTIPQLSNPQTLMAPLSNAQFWYAIIFFALTLVLFYATVLLVDEKNAIMTTIIGTGAGVLLSMILFTNEIFYSLAGLAFVAGSAVFVKMANAQRVELKWLNDPRAAASATGKLSLLIAVGLLVSIAAVSYTPVNRATLNQNFEDFITKQAFNTSDSLTNASADLLIQSQIQSIHIIQALPSYQALTDNNNAEDQAFVNNINSIQQQLQLPSTKEELQKKIAAQGNLNQNNFTKIVQQVPMIQTLEDNWWWIIALTVTILFLFLSNLVIKPLVMIGVAVVAFLIALIRSRGDETSSP